MALTRGRILPAEVAASAQTVQIPASKTLPDAKIIAPRVLEASDRAGRILNEAEACAREILERAEKQAAEIRLRAETEARANAAAHIATRALQQTAHEAKSDERTLDRSIELAKILAERLLGESLRVAPEQVTALARQALREARGARRIRILAHPEDIVVLSRALPALGIDSTLTELVAAPERTRGNLRLETDIGILDADLAPQLERLTLKLRETLENG